MIPTIERSKPFSPEEPENKKFTKRQKIIAALVGSAVVLTAGGVVAATTAFGGSQNKAPKPQPSNSAETNHLSATEKLTDLINKRPEANSDAYMKLFADIRTPYVKGQPAEEVVAEYEQNYWKLIELEFSDVKDMSYDDQTQWALENGTASREDTVNGIVNQLNLDYYASGVANTLYGPDALTSDFAKNSLPLIQANIKKDIIDYMLLKDKPDASTVHIVDSGIASSSDTEIHATPVGYTSDAGATAQNPNIHSSIHLKTAKKSETQTNWYLINNATDSGIN